MSKFATYGKFVATAGQRDALAQILLESAKSMQSVDGCDMYVVSISESEPEGRHVCFSYLSGISDNVSVFTTTSCTSRVTSTIWADCDCGWVNGCIA